MSPDAAKKPGPVAPSSVRGGDKEKAPRSFLFLQGPTSRFLEDVARCLIAMGHTVHHVNLNLGDQLFWRLPAFNYRGSFADWRDYVSAVMEAQQTTDLVIFADRRPYHIVAAEAARARGIPVVNLELGYLRPDWVTVEYDGMNTYSRFPRGAVAVRKLASEVQPMESGEHGTPFGILARLDLAYTLAELLGWAAYPRYRRHAIAHPVAEYAGWIATLVRQRLTRRRVSSEKAKLAAMSKGSYFLFALQLATDFQIRAHSHYGDLRDAVREALESFARAKLEQQRLVFIVHPLDSGLIDWHRYITRLAREAGVTDRISVISGGTSAALQRNAAGLVTVNSTLGLSALQNGIPVKVLGKAIFDLPGLSSQQSLAAFWRDPAPPDPALVESFTRAMIGTIQLRGSFYEPATRRATAAAVARRLDEGPYAFLPLSAAELAVRVHGPINRRVVVLGADTGLAGALARSHAAPGVDLHLVMLESSEPASFHEDCLRRGAMTSSVCFRPGDRQSLTDHLGALVEDAPVDVAILVIHACGGRAPLDPLGAAEVMASAMRPSGRRELGLIYLDDGGRPGDRQSAEEARTALLAMAGKLRNETAGVTVVFATHLGPARAGARPRHAVSEDRAAELIGAAMAAGKPTIELSFCRSATPAGSRVAACRPQSELQAFQTGA